MFSDSVERADSGLKPADDETRAFWPVEISDPSSAGVEQEQSAAFAHQDEEWSQNAECRDFVNVTDSSFLRKMASILGVGDSQALPGVDEQDVPALPRNAPLPGETCAADDASRQLDIVVSTSRLDRQGDIIETSGLDFSNYQKNPVVLWAHDLQRPPVGRVIRIASQQGEVRARVQFADTAFAREVFSLYAGGFLNAWSVGFLPTQWRQLTAAQGGGVHVLSAEVVEISAVPVPANPEALTKALERAGARKSLLTRTEGADAALATVSLRRAAQGVARILGRLAGESVYQAMNKG